MFSCQLCGRKEGIAIEGFVSTTLGGSRIGECFAMLWCGGYFRVGSIDSPMAVLRSSTRPLRSIYTHKNNRQYTFQFELIYCRVSRRGGGGA